MVAKPAVVLVPGSFAPPLLYEDFASKLRDDGFNRVSIVNLPSVGRKQPVASMADDAAAIGQIVDQLADEGNDILLVCHSYGGVPSTECVKGRSKKSREEVGKSGGIVRLLYTTALAPAVGQSILGISGSDLPDFVTVDPEYMSLDPAGHVHITFSDMSADQGLEFAKKLSEHSTQTYAAELTYAGYKDVPVSYLLCEGDMLIPPPAQQMMIDSIEKQSGNKVDVHKCSAGHFPYISQPEAVLDSIRKASG